MSTFMSSGSSLAVLTSLHTVVSLVAIVSGLATVAAMLASRRAAALSALFLSTTTATTVTGFLFPSTSVGLGHILGVASAVVLAPTILAACRHRLDGGWRWIYVVGALVALYLNVFIGIVQAFKKVDFLNALALASSGSAFLAAQLLVLGTFVTLGARAWKRFHPKAVTTGPEGLSGGLVARAGR